ncbi:MAG: AAA family ATPase [Tepidisphaerales bacterium]
MITQLNCIIVDADSANRTEMANFLANLGVNVASQMAVTDSLPSLLARPAAPQLVIVNLDPNPQDMLKRVGQLVRQFPSVYFFALSQTVDPHLLMEAMHVGIKEFVALPINEERFSAGIERVANLCGMGKRAKIVHLIPSQGGCGSTTVACNVAASLARDHKTVLLDLDLIRGAAASSFDLHPRYTIADIMESTDKLDPQLLDSALSLHAPSGLAVLARPELAEDSQRVTQPGMARLLSVLGRMYDYVVIDSLMHIDPVYNTVLQAADLNILVMQLNVPSAKNTERFVNSMRRLGIDSSKIQIVVNRYVKKGWDIAPEEVERTLGLKINWMIPNDFKNAIAAINYGEPVVLRTPKADMSLSLFDLADTLTRKAA